MTINLTTDQIMEKFAPSRQFHKLSFTKHTLDFANEPDQEYGIKEYERCGWTLVDAGPNASGYFFSAIKP